MLSDLTNTSWVLNSQLSRYACGSDEIKIYYVDIVTKEATSGLSGYFDPIDTFTEILIGYDSGAEQNRVNFYNSQTRTIYAFAIGHDIKTLPDTWIDYIDIPFTITGGADATNLDFIVWLESNATPYAPPSTATYYKTSSDELTSIADAIRSKAGTSNLLEFPTGFVDAITKL